MSRKSKEMASSRSVGWQRSRQDDVLLLLAEHLVKLLSQGNPPSTRRRKTRGGWCGLCCMGMHPQQSDITTLALRPRDILPGSVSSRCCALVETRQHGATLNSGYEASYACRKKQIHTYMHAWIHMYSPIHTYISIHKEGQTYILIHTYIPTYIQHPELPRQATSPLRRAKGTGAPVH